MDLKEALRIKLGDRPQISFLSDDNETIAKKVAYNSALVDIEIFIDEFDTGKIGKEYLHQLDRIQKGNF